MAIGFLLLLVVVGGGLAARAANTLADAGWLAEPLPLVSQEATVLTRYLRRHQVHRAVGASIGVVLAVVAGVRLYGEVNIGIGRRSPVGDLLFCGLAGSIVGTMSAETFRLSEPRREMSSASLAARTPLIPLQLVRLSRILTAGSLLAALVILFTTGDAAPVGIATSGLALAALTEGARRAITSRQRPVMSDRARWVDERMRWFAQRAVGNLQLAAAWLVAGWVVSKTGDDDRSWVTAVQFVVVLGCLIGAVVHLHRAAPRRPRGWTPPT